MSKIMHFRDIYLMIIIMIYSGVTYSQNVDSLTLEYCYSQAVENYPIVKQKEMYAEINKLKLSNLNSNYLPQININGQATYQSEVTELPISLPNVKIPELFKDMYKATLDINQLVYDGGNINKQIKIEKSNLSIDKQNIEIELYKLKERVNQLYFSIIILNKNKEIIELLRQDLLSKQKKIESSVKNGIMLSSNADAITAEIYKIDEQMIEINHNRNSAIKMLEILINKELNESVNYIIPIIKTDETKIEIFRPENYLFDLQIAKLNTTKELLSTKYLPKVYLFGQAGYGRPGLNMLTNKFSSFYLLGGKLTWNVYDWKQTKREKGIFDLQSNIISTQKSTFNKNIDIILQKEKDEIQKYKELILKDQSIIEVRERIIKSVSSQLDNGVVSSTEYITEINALNQSRLNLETHKIQLIYSKVNYITVLGKELSKVK